jgi:hypothetical protein
MADDKKHNSNRLFVCYTILACTLVCAALIYLLKPPDRNLVNVVTIIGTVLTVGGLVFAIREQSHIKKTSDAIKENTEILKNRLIKRSFELHVDKCIKFTSSIQENLFADPLLLRVHMRLVDLKECFIECKKIILLRDPKDHAVSEERIKKFEKFTEIITAYYIVIQVAKYQNDAIPNKEEFITNINEMQNFLNEVRESQSFSVI